MTRRHRCMTRKILFVVIAFSLSACGETGSGTSRAVEDFCKRADECNLLAPGISEDQCNENIGQCTDNLTESQAEDWTRDMNECEERSTCESWLACYNSVPYC
jgi:hypothetical protein